MAPRGPGTATCCQLRRGRTPSQLATDSCNLSRTLKLLLACRVRRVRLQWACHAKVGGAALARRTTQYALNHKMELRVSSHAGKQAGWQHVPVKMHGIVRSDRRRGRPNADLFMRRSCLCVPPERISVACARVRRDVCSIHAPRDCKKVTDT